MGHLGLASESECKCESKCVMDVYAIGSDVILDDDVSAKVIAVIIREGRVTYNVVWWNERSREETEVEAWEIRPDGDKAKTLRVNPIL